jgi:hypothetical protein
MVKLEFAANLSLEDLFPMENDDQGFAVIFMDEVMSEKNYIVLWREAAKTEGCGTRSEW